LGAKFSSAQALNKNLAKSVYNAGQNLSQRKNADALSHA